MAITEHAVASGSYHSKLIGSGTDKLDVSQLLEQWAHRDTPLLNKIKWEDDSLSLLAPQVVQGLQLRRQLNRFRRVHYYTLIFPVMLLASAFML